VWIVSDDLRLVALLFARFEDLVINSSFECLVVQAHLHEGILDVKVGKDDDCVRRAALVDQGILEPIHLN
jgi:hypothetical protein